jgi:hypothetical protein
MVFKISYQLSSIGVLLVNMGKLLYIDLIEMSIPHSPRILIASGRYVIENKGKSCLRLLHNY